MAKFERREEKDGIEERVIQIDRITRVVKGGRRLRFRAIVVVGDGKGKVGLAIDKSNEVVDAISKASRKARKEMVEINLSESTIPHEITAEYAGAKVFLKPARVGTGVIAGGAVRPILEVLGVKDVVSKIQGSNSKLNNSYATIKALRTLRKLETTKGTTKKPKTKKSSKPKTKETTNGPVEPKKTNKK